MIAERKPLEVLVNELPPADQEEVRDFVEFLLTKRKKKASYYLRQDWADALAEYRDQYTSLELQKLALE